MKQMIYIFAFFAIASLFAACKKDETENMDTISGNWYLPQIHPETLYLYRFENGTMTRKRFHNAQQDETVIRPYWQDGDTVFVEDMYDFPLRKWLVEMRGDSAEFTDITPNAPYWVGYTIVKY